jgi:nucleotide-binding universal stress UspA family protein
VIPGVDLAYQSGMLVQRRSPIVVGVDLSDSSDAVLSRALDEASRRERPAIHVVAAVPEPERHWWSLDRPEDDGSALLEDARRRLTALVSRDLEELLPEHRRVDWQVRLHVRRGAPAQVIVDLAAEVQAHLIVVGRFRETSIADRVVQLADCPVLVAPAARELPSQTQCPDCVEVRRRTDGEEWFCATHHTERVGFTTLILSGGPSGAPLGTL